MYGAGRITTLPADSLNKSAQYLHFVCVPNLQSQDGHPDPQNINQLLNISLQSSCFMLHSEAKAFLERKRQTRQLNIFILTVCPI